MLFFLRKVFFKADGYDKYLSHDGRRCGVYILDNKGLERLGKNLKSNGPDDLSEVPILTTFESFQQLSSFSLEQRKRCPDGPADESVWSIFVREDEKFAISLLSQQEFVETFARLHCLSSLPADFQWLQTIESSICLEQMEVMFADMGSESSTLGGSDGPFPFFLHRPALKGRLCNKPLPDVPEEIEESSQMSDDMLNTSAIEEHWDMGRSSDSSETKRRYVRRALPEAVRRETGKLRKPSPSQTPKTYLYKPLANLLCK